MSTWSIRCVPGHPSSAAHPAARSHQIPAAHMARGGHQAEDTCQAGALTQGPPQSLTVQFRDNLASHLQPAIPGRLQGSASRPGRNPMDVNHRQWAPPSQEELSQSHPSLCPFQPCGFWGPLGSSLRAGLLPPRCWHSPHRAPAHRTHG